MKKSIYMMILIFTIGLCSGCGKEETESNDLGIESESFQVEEQIDSASRENNDIELNDKLEIDFSFD